MLLGVGECLLLDSRSTERVLVRGVEIDAVQQEPRIMTYGTAGKMVHLWQEHSHPYHAESATPERDNCILTISSRARSQSHWCDRAERSASSTAADRRVRPASSPLAYRDTLPANCTA